MPVAAARYNPPCPPCCAGAAPLSVSSPLRPRGLSPDLNVPTVAERRKGWQEEMCSGGTKRSGAGYAEARASGHTGGRGVEVLMPDEELVRRLEAAVSGLDEDDRELVARALEAGPEGVLALEELVIRRRRGGPGPRRSPQPAPATRAEDGR